MTKMQIPQPTPDEYQRIKPLLSSFSGQFMKPVIFYGRYIQIESDAEGCRFVPHYQFVESDVRPEEITTEMRGILIRLSADGYLDCTEWEPMDDWDDVITRLQEWADETN
jgi:hypothetical protein